MGLGLSNWKEFNWSSVSPTFIWGITFKRINSKKHLAVASTSAEALWASANVSPNNLVCEEITLRRVKGDFN